MAIDGLAALSLSSATMVVTVAKPVEGLYLGRVVARSGMEGGGGHGAALGDGNRTEKLQLR
jgi:hypothetical protein